MESDLVLSLRFCRWSKLGVRPCLITKITVGGASLE